jgi:hypothetical protein
MAYLSKGGLQLKDKALVHTEQTWKAGAEGKAATICEPHEVDLSGISKEYLPC